MVVQKHGKQPTRKDKIGVDTRPKITGTRMEGGNRFRILGMETDENHGSDENHLSENTLRERSLGFELGSSRGKENRRPMGQGALGTRAGTGK